MDKYEYKIKAEEINDLIQKEDFVQAAEIADTIDWRRVKSVTMLCTISDVYKMNRRFEDAKYLLEMAYDRHPGSRTICYSLCELSLKTEDYVQAYEYYKQYTQIAPKDPGKYILKYKIYEAQDVSIEERIDVLKELKAHNGYHEKWLYELAYLYHRLGLVSQCVDECDELITMFGSGKYVIKALELKKLHQPLSPEQQKKYVDFAAQIAKEDQSGAPFVEPNFDDTKIYKKSSLSEKLTGAETSRQDQSAADGETKILPDVQKFLTGEEKEPAPSDTEINVKVMEPGYNTINLQETVAEGIREYLEKNLTKTADGKNGAKQPENTDGDTESFDFPEIAEVNEDDLEGEEEKGEIERTEVFFGDTSELQGAEIRTAAQTEMKAVTKEPAMGAVREVITPDPTAAAVMEQLRLESISEAARKAMEEAMPPKEMAEVLSEGYDGQISLVVPESQSIEKQITGQLNLDDILLEWERLKKENAQKNEEAVTRHVKEQTGEMFTEFEASLRDSLLEKLEKGEDVEQPGEQEAAAAAEENSVEETAMEENAVEEIAVEETVVKETITEENAAEEIAQEQEESVQKTETTQTAETTENAETAKAEETTVPEAERKAHRQLTQEEKVLFNDYIQSRTAKEQLIRILDNSTMAAYTGNIILTGDEGTDLITLSKNIVKKLKESDRNFTGKVARISGKNVNEKDIGELFDQVANGALIIEKAGVVSEEKADQLYCALQNENRGIMVILEDTPKAMNHFLAANRDLAECFTNRMAVQALNNDILVAYGKQYAYNMEYSISELGILAFHTRIEERQTLEHAVTVGEVKEIVDGAIRHANKKTLGHFFDILLAKRYDEEDMIVLGEKDFN